MHKKLKQSFIAFIPAIAWFITSFILLTLPGSDIPKYNFLEKIYFDKWVHVGMFCILVFLFSYPFIKTYATKSRIYLFVLVFAWAYGIAMEFVQKYYIPMRSFDIGDIIAD